MRLPTPTAHPDQQAAQTNKLSRERAIMFTNRNQWSICGPQLVTWNHEAMPQSSGIPMALATPTVPDAWIAFDLLDGKPTPPRTRLAS